jgi:hypothetical protein
MLTWTIAGQIGRLGVRTSRLAGGLVATERLLGCDPGGVASLKEKFA